MEEVGTLDGAALDNAVLDGAAELIAALDGAMLLGASLLATAEETLLEEDDDVFLSSSPPQPTNNMAINIAVNLPGLTLICAFSFFEQVSESVSIAQHPDSRYPCSGGINILTE